MDVIIPEFSIHPMESTLQKRVKARMDLLNVNAYQTAKKAGLGSSFVRDILRGRTRSPSTENLEKLALALETSIDYLRGKGSDNTLPIELPVVGLPVVSEINAGTWLEVTTMEDQSEPAIIPVANDPRFPRARQYALLVRGDSMDIDYPDGSYVTCVDFWDSGVPMKSGLHVHVERKRGGGQLVEITVKVLEMVDGSFILTPKSTNEKWKPFPVEGDDETEVVIKGLVTGGWRRTEI